MSRVKFLQHHRYLPRPISLPILSSSVPNAARLTEERPLRDTTLSSRVTAYTRDKNEVIAYNSPWHCGDELFRSGFLLSSTPLLVSPEEWKERQYVHDREKRWNVIDHALLPDPVTTTSNEGFLGIIKDFISLTWIADRVHANTIVRCVGGVGSCKRVLCTWDRFALREKNVDRYVRNSSCSCKCLTHFCN